MAGVAPEVDYSHRPLGAKLGFKEGMKVALLHAPEGMEEKLGPLPPGATVRHGVRRSSRVDMLIGFVTERSHLEANIDWLLTTLPPDGVFWVAWPKKASGVATDMSDHAVRDVALPLGWVDVKVCAIDGTWSGLKLMLRRELRPRT